MRTKEGVRGVVGVQKVSSARENLESQLRPLELTPPRATSSTLDLHSPKVLMSEVFYAPPPPPAPAPTHCMQLDFNTPLWAQRSGDKEFVLRHHHPHQHQHHHFGQGHPGLLTQLELSMLFYNLHALAATTPTLPHTTTTHTNTNTATTTSPPLPYKALTSEERLGKRAALWKWGQVRTPVQWREGGEDVVLGAKPCGPRLQKKALLFGGSDLPPPAPHTDSSAAPEVVERLCAERRVPPASEVEQLCAAPRVPPASEIEQLCATPKAPPASEIEQLCAEQASFRAPESRPSTSATNTSSSSSNGLKRTSPELPSRETKVKKREEGVTGREEEEEGSAGLMESIRAAAAETREDPRETHTVSPHSIVAFSGSESVSHHTGGRGAVKNVHATTMNDDDARTVQPPSSGRCKTRLAVDTLSDSWSSSSSSSSSSTFSSSPKVLREGGGGRHSDSSTPTNLSTSPLPPEDQQHCPPSPAPPLTTASIAAVASLSADALSASSSSDSSRPPLGRHEPLSARDCGSSALEDASKKASVSEMVVGVSQTLGSAEPRRLQKEAEASSSSHNGHLPPPPQPFFPGNCQGVEEDHVMSESDKPSSSPLSPSSSSASFSSCNEILTDRDHVEGSSPSKTATTVKQKKSSGRRQSSSSCSVDEDEEEEEEEKSLCTFYLESSDSPVKSCFQWESVLDQEMEEDRELTSLLGNLCLQPQPLSAHRGPRENKGEGDRETQAWSNGVAMNGVAKVQPHSNGHASGDIAQNGESPRSVTNRSSSLAYRLACNGCPGSRSPCDNFPFRRGEDEEEDIEDESIGGGVSIPNSPLVPATHLGKAVDQRQHASITTNTNSESETLCRSVLTPCLFASRVGAKNQTTATATATAAEIDDSVFHDRVSDNVSDSGSSGGGVVVAVAAPPHCPSRTKSAPSFYCLTTTGKGEEKSEERGGEVVTPEEMMRRGRPALREKEGQVKAAGSDRIRHRLVKSASILFNSRGSVPSQSSPAPIKRRSTGRFDYDETLTTTKAIKSAISLSRLPDVCKDSSDSLGKSDRVLSTSAPASTNCLLGNFEESILNGRLEPAGVVEGFSIDIGASGKFCPRHVSLPVTAYFFNLSDDNAPSPYLGHINLDSLGKRGYHIPNVGTLQVTLFNPNRTVVKMFVVRYDLQDMPPNCQTVLRQRTLYQPLHPHSDLPSYLRYLIHLRICSSSSGKTYLHTDIRLIFARNKFELDSNDVQYKLCSYTETPLDPKYSPKR